MTPKVNIAFENANDKIIELDSQGKDIYSSEMLESYKLRNSFGLDPNTEIHRIFQKQFYDYDVHQGCLTLPLADPAGWEDSLENPLADVKGFDPVTKGEIHYGSLVDQFYALCWTTHPDPTETDWESFSHGNDAVRISTTVGRLLDRLMLKTDPLYMHRTWIVSVDYQDPSAIKKMKNPNFVKRSMESTGGRLAASAAVVRTCFSGEDEVRLLFDYSLKPDLKGVSCISINKKKYLRIPFDWIDFVVKSTDRP